MENERAEVVADYTLAVDMVVVHIDTVVADVDDYEQALDRCWCYLNNTMNNHDADRIILTKHCAWLLWYILLLLVNTHLTIRNR
jgi:hypothetical protein